MRRRVWLLGVLALAMLVVGVVRWNSREVYKRYVSPPLKDGTRYTFLYPSRMSRNGLGISIGSGVRCPSMEVHSMALGDCDNSPPSAVSTFLERFLPRSASEFGWSGVDVLVSKEDSLWLSGRSETNNDSESFVSRALFISDARARLRFKVDCFVLKERPRAQSEVRTVIRSFRILPPNTPVPSP